MNSLLKKVPITNIEISIKRVAAHEENSNDEVTYLSMKRGLLMKRDVYQWREPLSIRRASIDEGSQIQKVHLQDSDYANRSSFLIQELHDSIVTFKPFSQLFMMSYE